MIMPDMPSWEISSEPSGHAVPSESTDLTPLVVFRRDSEPESDNVDPNHQNIQDLELGAYLNYQNTQNMIVNTKNWRSAQQYESNDALWTENLPSAQEYEGSAGFWASVEADDDYLCEFFLPPGIRDGIQLPNLVQTLKQNVEVSKSLGTADPESIRVYRDKEQNWTGDPFKLHDSRVVGSRENNKVISHLNVIPQMNDNITDAEEKHNPVKQDRKRKRDSLTMEAVEKHRGKRLDEACEIFGVSRSTLKRFCREHGISSWPLPKHSNKPVCNTGNSRPKHNLQRLSNTRLGISFVVFLMVRVKRWSCSIRRHGFSGKWWSCGRHSYLPSKSDLIYQAALHNGAQPAVIESMAKPKYTLNNIIPYSRVAESSLIVQFTAKQTVADNTDIKMVTVKATYEEDTIRFQFPTSSGLLELEHEVARRIDLKGRKLRLRYKDEENELITLGCDDDLLYLLGFTVKHSTIKLLVKAV